MNIPESIRKHLTSHQIEALKPAWVELTSGSEHIKSMGGAWQVYFKGKPQPDQRISDICELLQGMLPIVEDFELPHMQLNNDAYTDILAFKDEQSDWLLFFDVTDKVLQLQKYQQVANELNLLKDQMSRTLGRYVGQEVSQRALDGKLSFKVEGERKEITTLFVDIRGFTPFNESHDAQEVMNTLNQYMNGMLKPILAFDGMIDKIMGDGAMAVFGVLPSDISSVDNAFHAALDIQRQTKATNILRKEAGQPILGVGVGIATGDAVLGILGSHERRAFTAIGKHVNLAARLESNARAGEILMDSKTLSALSDKPQCHKVSIELKGIGKTEVFAILPS